MQKWCEGMREEWDKWKEEKGKGSETEREK
jgi:hypothetical protein